MNIDRRMVGGVVILTITGDIATGEGGGGGVRVGDKVRSEVQQGNHNIVLDLSHVQYVDSPGLGELVHAFTAARNRGGAVKLIKVNKRISDLLVLTKLVTIFECFDTEAEAVVSFKTADR